jgi:hypothetical protein
VGFYSRGNDSKTRGAADPCRRQEVKQNLSPYFGVLHIFDGPPFMGETTPAWPAYPRGQLRVLMPCIENRLHQQHLTCLIRRLRRHQPLSVAIGKAARSSVQR